MTGPASAAADRAEAARVYGIFLLFLLAWTLFVALLWRTQALMAMALFWLKVPLWLLPVAVIAAARRDWLVDFGIVGPPLRAMAFAIGAALLVAGKDFVRLEWFDRRAPAWSPALATLLMAVAPLLEELLFRGAIQPALVRRHGLGLGIAITALMFLAVHLPGWLLLRPPPLWSAAYVLGFGLFLGWLRHASQSLWAPLLAHWVNNVGARL